MKWLNKIRIIFFCFTCVTTCVVFVTAVYIPVFWGQVSVGVELLWQILFISFLCSLPAMFYPVREVRAIKAVLIIAAHYIEVNVIVMCCGLWFEWFKPDSLSMVIGMFFLIALVFVVVSAIMWTKEKRLADRMNEKLKRFQDD